MVRRDLRFPSVQLRPPAGPANEWTSLLQMNGELNGSLAALKNQKLKVDAQRSRARA